MIGSNGRSEGTYLPVLRSGLVSTGTRRKETRAGVRLAEIVDKNMKTALTTYFLKLAIPVSFLLRPDIYRTDHQRHSPTIGKANFGYLQYITRVIQEWYVPR